MWMSKFACSSLAKGHVVPGVVVLEVGNNELNMFCVSDKQCINFDHQKGR